MEMIQLILNSFVRRTNNTDQLKTIIHKCGGQLHRKGRSRNWVLTLNRQQMEEIIKLIQSKNEPSWHWLSKKILEHKPKLNRNQLIEIAKQDPCMTVSSLMRLTDCSLLEARTVLDDIEWE